MLNLFWRDDITWYGIGPEVDRADHSLTQAYCLHGASQNDQDIYIMINAWLQDLTFTIQEGIAAN